ncbi:MAG: hypothetical protein WAM03_09280, partial [Pseudolabrys sp.]
MLIRISFGSAASRRRTTEAPPRPSSRRGRIPELALSLGTGQSSALFAEESQSFLDSLIAGIDLSFPKISSDLD